MEATITQNVTSVQIFKNPQFGQLRTIGTSECPLFAATDLCRMLGYSNTSKAINDHTEPEERYNVSLERGGKMLFITESGLYALIFRSNKPDAKNFRKWVTSEVLPTIRKTGGYSVPGKPTQKTPVKKLRQAADVYPIIPFSSPVLGEIRTRNYNGTILFCYIDVWKALGFSCGTLLKRYLDGARFRYLETPTNQGIQIAGYIDEENLSRCIFRCKDRNLAASMENLVETQILSYYEGGNVAIDEPAKPKLIVKTKLCPELAEIIGEVFVVIEKFNDYKLATGLTSEEFLPIHVAEQSLFQLKEALKTMYDHAYIQDLECTL